MRSRAGRAHRRGARARADRSDAVIAAGRRRPGPRQRIPGQAAANAEKLVRIRPLDEVAGSDPAAIVARVEVKAARADLAGALAELAKLPDAARAPAEAWIKQAQARAAAIDASRKLAADALSGLSK